MPDPVWLIIGLVIGVSLTIFGALYQERRARKQLLKALSKEVSYDKNLFLQFRGQLQHINTIRFDTFDTIKTLQTASYYKARESGVLAYLPDDIYEDMSNAYHLIHRILELCAKEDLIVYKALIISLNDKLSEKLERLDINLQKHLKLKKQVHYAL
jgi:hypothetical protein